MEAMSNPSTSTPAPSIPLTQLPPLRFPTLNSLLRLGSLRFNTITMPILLLRRRRTDLQELRRILRRPALWARGDAAFAACAALTNPPLNQPQGTWGNFVLAVLWRVLAAATRRLPRNVRRHWHATAGDAIACCLRGRPHLAPVRIRRGHFWAPSSWYEIAILLFQASALTAVADPQCSRCRHGPYPFHDCTRIRRDDVDYRFLGDCTNCVLHGHRCSLGSAFPGDAADPILH